MKKALLYLIVFLFSNCNSKRIPEIELEKERIVDYNQSNDYYNRSLNFKAYEKRMKEQTIFLINDKSVSFEEFKQALADNAINRTKTIEDSIEINTLNYSYDKVKKIIIGTKQ